MSVVSVVCCQVEVSATNWPLVQRSPTDCSASLGVIWKPHLRGAKHQSIVVYFLLGTSPASNCSCPTFRIPVSVPSSKAGCTVWLNLRDLLAGGELITLVSLQVRLPAHQLIEYLVLWLLIKIQNVLKKRKKSSEFYTKRTLILAAKRSHY